MPENGLGGRGLSVVSYGRLLGIRAALLPDARPGRNRCRCAGFQRSGREHLLEIPRGAAMKKIIVRAKPDTRTDSRNPTGKARGAPSSRRRQPTASSGSGHRTFFVFLFVGLLLAVGIALLRSASSCLPPPLAAPSAPPRQEKPYEPQRYPDLGGLTIAEWMARHPDASPELKARQQRIRQFASGQPAR